MPVVYACTPQPVRPEAQSSELIFEGSEVVHMDGRQLPPDWACKLLLPPHQLWNNNSTMEALLLE